MKRLLTLSLLVVSAFAYGSAELRSVGFLPGGNQASALGVSADGNWVIGLSTGLNGIEAFRWSLATGMQGLGDFEEGIFLSAAYGVSQDGSVVVGIGTRDGYQEGFRWTQSTGFVGLGNLDDIPGLGSVGYAVRADGTTVAGVSDRLNAIEAFRKIGNAPMTGIGFFPGDVVFFSEAYGISANGGVVVGHAETGVAIQAFRWQQVGGMEGLGYLPGGSFSVAYGVSADGNVAVGMGDTDTGIKAFRWSPGAGIIGLTDLSGGDASIANAISGDGLTIVGETGSPQGDVAFVHRSFNMRSVANVLTQDYGLDLTGWVLRNATGVNHDGTVIVGYGTYLGQQVGWVARLPQPGTVIAPVDLQSYLGNPQSQSLAVELRNPGSLVPIETHPGPVDSSGNVRFVTALRGTYDLAIKGPHWLRVVKTIVITDTGATTPTYSLRNGDVDGDNEVTIGDYALLSTAFGSTPGDPNWNPLADLDGDDEVSIGDYAVMSAEFGAMGDD